MATSGPSIQRGEWKRKAGDYEWTKYATVDVVSPSIGADAIRHVKVDCRFLFEQCQWGILQSGSRQHLAGIVHMELAFHQPIDCKLARANICLTLDEKDPALVTFRQRWQFPSFPTSRCPVQITDFYGPRYILGQTSTASIKDSVRLQPEINVGVGGASLGSLERERQHIQQSRWKFETYRKPGQSNVLNFEMTENDISKYPLERTTVYAAFTYVHSGQPFLMKLKISGKLHRLSDRVKDFPKKLFGGFGTSRDSCVTLVEAYVGPRFPLDEEAKSLNAAMIRKNDREAASTQNEQVTEQHQPTFDNDGQSGTQSQSQGQCSSAFLERVTPSTREEQECPLESLAEAGQYLLGSQPGQDPLGQEYEPDGEGSASTRSSPTLVASQALRNDPKDLETLESDGDHGDDDDEEEEVVENSDEDADVRMLNEPRKKFPLAWSSQSWFMGLNFLFLAILYAHLIQQMREVSRESQ